MNFVLDDQRIATAATGWAVLVVGVLLWAAPANAQQTQTVVVDSDAGTCPAELTSQFISELRLRTTAELVSDPFEGRQTETGRVTLEAVDETSCEVRLQKDEETKSLLVDRDAGQVEIASAALRLAWIIDGRDVPVASPVPEPSSDASGIQLASAVTIREAGDAGERVVEIAGGLSTRTEQPQQAFPPFSLGAVGGATWLPSADGVVPVTRLAAGWRPWPNVDFQISGNLPVAAAGGTASDGGRRYRPWSFDLTAGYVRQFGDNWAVELSGGVRRTTFALSATEPTESGDFTSSSDTNGSNTNGSNSTESETSNTGTTNDDNADSNATDANTAEANSREANSTEANSQNANARESNSTEANRSEEDRPQSNGEQTTDDTSTDDSGESTSETTSDTSDDSSGSIPDSLSSWSLVTHVAVSYRFTPRLAVVLDGGMAMSPMRRQVLDDRGNVVMDLGHLDVEMSLGVQLSF